MRVATDVGGTFTDLVYMTDEGQIGFEKSSTTPPNFEQGVLDVLEKSQIAYGDIETFIHGTTVIINALTERKGVKTGLITTKGFRDVLEIGRGNRPDLFNVRYQKPKPIIPRSLRREVSARLNYKGEVLQRLKKNELEAIIKDFREAQVEAVAVVFLHSYKNPDHEKEAADLIKQLWPEISVTASHEIVQEWREYERTNTTAMNSFIKPIAASYVDKLDKSLSQRGVKGQKYIMQSNGGTAPFSLAKDAPINMVESGPVAGVFGAAMLGSILSEENIIAFDVGGTTAKCSLIEQGNVKVSTDYYIEKTEKWAGYPLKVPVVDIVEIGNGGGSIAWLETSGSIRVGPHSAGAVPGPVAYGSGGTEPTITDANLVTGRLSPNNFEHPVDMVKVQDVIREKIAEPFGVTVEEAALGIIRVANSNMLNALKLISVRKGYDPRDFTMVAFGGGGPLHSSFLAGELGIRKVIIPAASAVFSAWGMLMTDLRQDTIQTYIQRFDTADPGRLNKEWSILEKQAMDRYKEDGLNEQKVVFARYADIRYIGQEHAVKVPVPGGIWETDTLNLINESFHDLHEKTYTFRLQDTGIEFVGLHLTAFGRVNRPPLKQLDSSNKKAAEAGCTRDVFFEERGWLETKVYKRSELNPDMRMDGPAIIEDRMSSVLVYPNQHLKVDLYGNLIIFIGGGLGA
ncbi:hydantoinase/oxoprolinase family protein [Mesobacillus harenae]|uniref:hydantoinase/oxoprolinase family protein n=1 Tax=Mesobacillus harenae TaxID=2213203 RepID=UPI0015812B93|nr:hydantoinase/oxoprolinase family protein [Mesobacillus harenae]